MSLCTQNKTHNLNEILDGYDHEAQETIIRKFYQGVYDAGLYRPGNSTKQWRIVCETHAGDIRTALDVGCGAGVGVRLAVDAGIECYGIDIAHPRDLWRDHDVSRRCVVGDGANLPFASKAFDFVLCMDVLEHVPVWNVGKFLGEIERVCRGVSFLAVSLVEEKSPIAGKVCAHITLMSEEWWREQIGKAGMRPVDSGVEKDHLWGYFVPDRR